VLLTTAVSLGSGSQSAPVKAAEPSCGPFYTTPQFGDYSTMVQPEGFEGASINFTSDPPVPTLCNIYGNGNNSSAWAMVQDHHGRLWQAGLYYAPLTGNPSIACTRPGGNPT
jgi:hypothetical protein